MRKWRCTVCGYIHTGDEPPESCPVCGADKTLFEKIAEKEESASPHEKVDEKKWRCTVCGYIHTGEEPPENCPACGADKSLFEEVVEKEAAAIPDGGKEAPPIDESPKTTLDRLYALVTPQILKHHFHPMSVHIPNGVIPISFVFILLSSLFGATNFGTAAHYNMIFVVLTLPIVLFSGYVEWQNRYGGHMTNFFLTKIVCASIVGVLSVIVVIWWNIEPDIAISSTPGHKLFLFFNIIMLGAAGVAGFIGGKLVFKD